MDAVNSGYYSLVELRIEETFMEIDSEICADLQKNDAEYIKLWQEMTALQKEYPIIQKVIEGTGEISLSAEEHKSLSWYLRLRHCLENIERRQIYFCGHADNYCYLKRIKAL